MVNQINLNKSESHKKSIEYIMNKESNEWMIIIMIMNDNERMQINNNNEKKALNDTIHK